MATLKEQIDEAVESIQTTWNTSNSRPTVATDVPSSTDLGYSDAKKVEATYLYTDMVDSSGLVSAASEYPSTVASVIAAYLKASVRIIRHGNGHIRSFDGDRVMGIFVGPDKEDRAVTAALKINAAVQLNLNPAIKAKFASLTNSDWNLKQMTGIATGSALLIRAGIRNNADMVSIGLAPNLAAKLSDLRGFSNGNIAVGAGTFGRLSRGQTHTNSGDYMWSGPKSVSVGGGSYNYYTSSFRRHIS